MPRKILFNIRQTKIMLPNDEHDSNNKVISGRDITEMMVHFENFYGKN